MTKLQICVGVAMIAGATGLASAAGQVYWSEAACSEVCFSALWRSELDGNNVTRLTAVRPVNIIGVALDPVHGRVDWTEFSPGGAMILRGDEGGCEIVSTSSFGLFGQLQIDHGKAKLYVDRLASIWRMNLDGSELEPVYQPNLLLRDFALDTSAGKIYVAVEVDSSAWASDRIIRFNLDGSGAESIHSGPTILQLALDPPDRKIYWLEKSSSLLRRANLDGSADEDMMSLTSGASDLAIDAGAGKIYWAATSSSGLGDAIFRRNLDGSGHETVVQVLGSIGQIALDPADQTGVASIPCDAAAQPVPAIGWIGGLILVLLSMIASARFARTG
jgi:hypothetical protein